MGKIEGGNPGLGSAIVFAMLMGGISITLGALLYPAFQTLILRWWSSGLRFGDLEMRSRLLLRHVYGAYARFIGYAGLFGLAIAIAGTVALLLTDALAGSDASGQIATTLVLLIGYVITVLGISTIYRATVLFSLWQLGMESLQLSGLSALEKVKASGRPSSAFGEGLADALNVGSY